VKRQIDLTDVVLKAEVDKYNDTEQDRKAKLRAVNASSASPEWYTPKQLVNVVIKALGEIDLDPCSNVAPYNVPAKKHYTKDDDGLSQPWEGRVFMNPPYGKTIPQWTKRLEDEYNAGNVAEAIALVPARVDTRWYHYISKHTVCFIKGRIRFELDGVKSNPSIFPSVAIYLGKDDTNFLSVFKDQGVTYRYI
jgi:hypothetical protein